MQTTPAKISVRRARGALAHDGSYDTRNPYLGVAAKVERLNEHLVKPYCAKRAGMVVQFAGSHFSSEQPSSMWIAGSTATHAGPMYLGTREELSSGDVLEVLEDPLFDFSVGVPFVKIKRKISGSVGYVPLESFIGDTTPVDASLWTAHERGRLRSLVEFRNGSRVLYSTNRVSAKEVEESIKFLLATVNGTTDGDESSVHPLQAGAHAHRLGAWALADGRSSDERASATDAIDGMLRAYAVPKCNELRNGSIAWPYEFDFKMPWGTKLNKPWYSGYANAAMLGALACASVLCDEREYAELARGAARFLQLPMDLGGAMYECDGFRYIAEYVYKSPPIPNYRVLDGELCSVVYIYNAALLLGDSLLLRLAIQLAAGIAASIPLFTSTRGLPVFGMDGQAMNPNYMWQLWVTLQLLGNAFKDRTFSEFAKDWYQGIPTSYFDDGFPS